MTSQRGAPGVPQTSILDNGIQVVTEGIRGVRSAAVGVWVRQGAAHEPQASLGASHMLEHMAFKGTQKRTPREIAMALESLGGSLDAYTSREHTSYQARVLDENLVQAVDVLADLVLDPVLKDRDLDREKEVVLEEIATVEDTPDDLVFELHGDEMWGGHAYGNSILGSRQSVTALTQSDLATLHRENYTGKKLVVAAAGNIEHEEVVDLVSAHFSQLAPGSDRPPLPNPTPPQGGERWVERESAQTHIVMGRMTPGHSDPDRYALVLLSAAFGGGMSSRLFQRIREELALAYSVYSFQSFYSQAGVAGVYVGTRPAWGESAVSALREEFGLLFKDGLPADELHQIKQQVKGQIMLSLESTGSRLYRLAGFALYDEPFVPLDDLLGKIEGVTESDIKRVAEDVFNPDLQYTLCLGPTQPGS
ncbi:MAG: M16 family metallopeptidase [Longimicrobiales bacterium]